MMKIPTCHPYRLKLLAQVPPVYAAPGIKTKEKHATFYRVFVGPGTDCPAGTAHVEVAGFRPASGGLSDPLQVAARVGCQQQSLTIAINHEFLGKRLRGAPFFNGFPWSRTVCVANWMAVDIRVLHY